MPSLSKCQSNSENDFVENIRNELNNKNSEISEQEKVYMKSYRNKELKARKHLKKQAYSTVLAVLFFKFFTFYESTFYLIFRIMLTYAMFTFSEPARIAVEEAVNRSGSIERLVNDINRTLRENRLVVNTVVEDEAGNSNSMEHELDDLDSLDFTASPEQAASSNNAEEPVNHSNLGDTELPGGFTTSDDANDAPDNNTGTVTFTSNFGGINFRVKTNADFGGVHNSINDEQSNGEITSITPSMVKKLKAASEDFLMKQFNKKFKFILYADIFMIVFRIVFPLNNEDFTKRRGYAFIDIFSDYKKYPDFFNESVLFLNLYNLLFEIIILGLHITLYQVACLENPKLHKLKKKMVLLQFRCKQLLNKNDGSIEINQDKNLLKHSKPFNLVYINAVDAIKRE